MIVSFIKKEPVDSLIILAATLFLLYYFRGCISPKPVIQSSSQQSQLPPATHDTGSKTVEGKAVQLQPIIFQTTPATQATIPLEYQSLSSNVAELTKQVQSLAATLYATNHYENKVSLKDSAGKEVGEVNLSQDVSENKLKPFTPTYKLQIPVITNNIPYAVEMPYKERNRLSVGGGIFGNQFTPISGLKAGILAQNKRGVTIEVNATRTWSYWGGDLGIYKVLSLRKK